MTGWTGRLVVLSLPWLLLPLTQAPVSAAAPPCNDLQLETCPSAAGSATVDDFGIEVVQGTRGGGSGSGSGTAGGAQTVTLPVQVEQRGFTLACSGNSPGASNDTCPSAVGVCPLPEQTAYWVFTRTRNRVTNDASPWVREMNPPYVCRTPTDPEIEEVVPPEILIGIELDRDFASLPLPKGDITVRPQGDTLVNVETRFSTATSSQPLAPLTILGRAVTVTAAAERYDWVLGDGTTLQDAGPGSEAEPIRHVYRERGDVAPFVRITWSGTFTVAGIAGSFDITGTAVTDGTPVPLRVRAASAELVDG